ncbi:MAG TPA: proteasome activator [Acidimicrobiales bacterium]|nr:proteasome activator [Acidimicrobiales bacterium]|tara:strand:- start:3184 stop:3672 length:489 start_codon:yes stop_codon:yes gene_type:complete
MEPNSQEEIQQTEVLTSSSNPEDIAELEISEAVEQPAKVMRVGTMMKQLLEEVRSATLDEASRGRLKEIFDTSVKEIGSTLTEDLREELDRLVIPFDEEAPTAAELQIAHAQLVGWLEGLVQGIQATLFAQQMAAQQQLAGMRRGEIEAVKPPSEDQHGNYL